MSNSTTIPAESVAVANRLGELMGEKDLRGLEDIFAEDSIIWHNFNNREVSKAENLAGLEALFAAVDAVSYTDVRRQPLAGGFIEQHNLVCRRAGEIVEMPACMLIEVCNGRIARMDEYIDPAPLFRLLPNGLHSDPPTAAI